jgi:hypothetical protein
LTTEDEDELFPTESENAPTNWKFKTIIVLTTAFEPKTERVWGQMIF